MTFSFSLFTATQTIRDQEQTATEHREAAGRDAGVTLWNSWSTGMLFVVFGDDVFLPLPLVSERLRERRGCQWPHDQRSRQCYR